MEVAHLYDPGAFEPGMLTRDLSAGCAWSHTSQEEMVVRVCKTEASSAVLCEIKFTEVDGFLKCFEIWVWGHVDRSHVSFPNEIFGHDVRW